MEKENKYTQEEINAILDEVNRKMDLKLSRKLTTDELENVSGGTLDKVMALSHQEIDKMFDALQIILKEYGPDVARLQLMDWGFLDTARTNGFYDKNPAGEMEQLRQHTHDRRDGTSCGWNIQGI